MPHPFQAAPVRVEEQVPRSAADVEPAAALLVAHQRKPGPFADAAGRLATSLAAAGLGGDLSFRSPYTMFEGHRGYLLFGLGPSGGSLPAHPLGRFLFMVAQLYQLVITCQMMYNIGSEAHNKGDSYYADGGRDLLHAPGGSRKAQG